MDASIYNINRFVKIIFWMIQSNIYLAEIKGLTRYAL